MGEILFNFVVLLLFWWKSLWILEENFLAYMKKLLPYSVLFSILYYNRKNFRISGEPSSHFSRNSSEGITLDFRWKLLLLEVSLYSRSFMFLEFQRNIFQILKVILCEFWEKAYLVFDTKLPRYFLKKILFRFLAELSGIWDQSLHVQGKNPPIFRVKSLSFLWITCWDQHSQGYKRISLHISWKIFYVFEWKLCRFRQKASQDFGTNLFRILEKKISLDFLLDSRRKAGRI